MGLAEISLESYEDIGVEVRFWEELITTSKAFILQPITGRTLDLDM